MESARKKSRLRLCPELRQEVKEERGKKGRRKGEERGARSIFDLAFSDND